MEKTAKISLVGHSANQDEKVSLFTVGKVTYEKNAVTVEYEEITEENVHLRTTICISNNIVTLNKFGNGVSTMVFQPGAVSSATLNTPFGEVETSIRTEEVTVRETDRELTVLLKYVISLENGDVLNDSELKLSCIFS